MSAEVEARRAGRLPRWACRASLFQPREPAFWLYVLLLVGTGLLALGEQRSLREMSPSGWVLSWLLLALYLVPMFLLVYLLDAYERAPLSLVLGALAWGAVAATSLAGLANHDWGRWSPVSADLTWPPSGRPPSPPRWWRRPSRRSGWCSST